MTPDREREELRERWEQRAREHGDQPRGVLFQGLPEPLNQAIHRWHRHIVASFFASCLPPQAKVVDLAAGYGRLSSSVRDTRADVWLTGADFSPTYSRLYRENIGPAVCADMAHMPYPASTWDGVLLVTGLMYLEEDECGPVLEQILHSIKPGGVLLCIDPGAEITRLIRWLRLCAQPRTTGGDGFRRDRYLDLFACSGCSIICKGSNALFTLCLPLLLLLQRFSVRCPGLVMAVANQAVTLDIRMGLFTHLALHRWVLVQKTNG